MQERNAAAAFGHLDIALGGRLIERIEVGGSDCRAAEIERPGSPRIESNVRGFSLPALRGFHDLDLRVLIEIEDHLFAVRQLDHKFQ